VNRQLAEQAARVLAGERLQRAAAASLVAAGREHPYELLFWANEVRRGRFANAVRFCSIVPGKLGACSEDCRWCAQTARKLQPMPAARTPNEQIVSAARQAARRGAASFGIVNSGRHPTPQDLRAVTAAARDIRQQGAGSVGLCASLGGLTDEQAAELAAAGIVRYNHNLETSRRRFAELVTTHTYDDRLATLGAARRAGLRLCCGGIFGVGETWDDRIELALTLRDQVAPDVVPLNFLQPIPGTALEASPPLPPIECLQITAVFRLILPDVDIKIAGGRETALRDLQSWMFYAGATSCILGDYLTTRGRDVEADLQMVADLGLEVVADL